jgi:formylglycine-generating enzyme required for sulfatase activity
MNLPGKPVAPPEDGRTIFLDPGRPVTASPPAVDRLLERGSIVDNRFRLREMIGEGNTSRIYKALDLANSAKTDSHVALKLLKAPLGNNAAAVQYLDDTARALNSDPHPNIARISACGSDGNTAFLAMELLPAKSLARKIRHADGEPLPREEALRIIEDIAAALEFAHARNIVHGDLKPGNVLITDADVTKVIDFGLTRVTGRLVTGLPSGASNTIRGMRALALSYASPEVVDLGEPDLRDDVFALACIAWHLLSGEHPFEGQVSTAARDSRMTLARTSQLTECEFKALSRALAFSRSRRPLSVRQFMAEFKGAPPARSNKRVTVGIGAVLAVTLATAAFFTFRGSSPGALQAPSNIADAAPAALPVGATFRDCASCPLMKVLPSGQFLQGSAAALDAQPFEIPQHNVSIGYQIAAGVYEITVSQFAQYVANTGEDMHGCPVASQAQTASSAMSCVSWQDAKRFAAWLSQRTHHLYRLPSSSEWEYAARIGGLYDMSGNVLEWVEDCWANDYAGAPSDGSARIDGDCSQRELRGGSSPTPPDQGRVAHRDRSPIDSRSASAAFRLVREINE